MDFIEKVPLDQFLKFHTSLSLSKNSKYVSDTTKFYLNELSNSEFGSDRWNICFNYSTKLNNAIESFNLYRVGLKSIGTIFANNQKINQIISVIDSSWDQYVCNPNSIQNYIEYYKKKEIVATHPLLFVVKSFGLSCLGKSETINPDILKQSLDSFLNQYNVTNVPSVENYKIPNETFTNSKTLNDELKFLIDNTAQDDQILNTEIVKENNKRPFQDDLQTSKQLPSMPSLSPIHTQLDDDDNQHAANTANTANTDNHVDKKYKIDNNLQDDNLPDSDSETGEESDSDDYDSDTDIHKRSIKISNEDEDDQDEYEAIDAIKIPVGNFIN